MTAAWFLHALTTWLIPAVLAAIALVLAQWDKTKPLYSTEALIAVFLGVIGGYFAQKLCMISGVELVMRWIPGYSALASLFAKPIVLLLLKNRWVILKAKTGLDGNDEIDKK